MLGRIFGLLLFLALLAMLVLNFKQVMDYTIATNLKHSTQTSVDRHYWGKAISEYESALKANPNNHNIALRLGWLYTSSAQDPANAAVRTSSADEAAQWRKMEAQKAEAVYRDVLKSDPNNLEAQIGLANAIQMTPGRYNEAIDVLREALKAHSGSAPLLNEIGNVYKKAAEDPREHRPQARKYLYDQARYYYGLSTEINPNLFQSQFNLGVAFQNKGKLETNGQEMDRNLRAASFAYCKALRLLPDSYEARYNLGLTLIDLNYLDEGYRQLDKSVDILKSRATEADLGMAQRLAGQIQHVKSKVFNSDKASGLDAGSNPDFLSEECLLKPAAATQ